MILQVDEEEMKEIPTYKECNVAKVSTNSKDHRLSFNTLKVQLQWGP